MGGSGQHDNFSCLEVPNPLLDEKAPRSTTEPCGFAGYQSDAPPKRKFRSPIATKRERPDFRE